MRERFDLDDIGEPDQEIEAEIATGVSVKKGKEKVKPYGVDRAMVRVVLHCPIRSGDTLPGSEGVGIVRLDIEPKGDLIIMKWWSMARRYVGWFTRSEWLAISREMEIEIARQAHERIQAKDSIQDEVGKLRTANSLLLCRVEELERTIALMEDEKHGR